MPTLSKKPTLRSYAALVVETTCLSYGLAMRAVTIIGVANCAKLTELNTDEMFQFLIDETKARRPSNSVSTVLAKIRSEVQ